jgi:polygalacturonase
MPTHNLARRSFFRNAARGLLAVPLAASLLDLNAQQTPAPQEAEKGKTVPPPPALTLNVRDFGAKADGVTKDTVALQQAIDRCWVLGGGEAVVPAGEYLTGALALRSNTILRLEKDAHLIGSPDLADYPVAQVRWEGKWIQGHVALIYAMDANHTGIVGPGKLTGNQKVGGRPNQAYPLRHPALVEPIGCNDVRFEDFSTEQLGTMWCLHATYCENLLYKNLTIRSTSGNGDGIDIDSCKHVRIEGCDIATGDDCISIKSGRGEEAYQLLRTSEDVLITNCTFADSIFACIGIGSETSGGIRNVRIEHCKFTRARTFAIYIKSRPGRGAFIEDIVADDLDVAGTTGGFLRFNILNSGIQDQDPVPGDEGIPTIKNFRFSNVRLTDCPLLVDGTGIHPHKPLDGFWLTNVTGTCARGMSLVNIKNAVIRDVRVTGVTGPLISVNNVTGEGLEGAAQMDAPELPDPVREPAKPYILH